VFALRLRARALCSGLTPSLSRGFRGTPPPKPLRCKFKIRRRHSTALGVNRWAEPTGGKPRVSRACFRVVPLVSSNMDIIKMSPGSCSQSIHLSFKLIPRSTIPTSLKKEKPCLLSGKQGFGSRYSFRYLPTKGYPKFDSGFWPRCDLDSPRTNTPPGLGSLHRIALATDVVGQAVADMLMQYPIRTALPVTQHPTCGPLISRGDALFSIRISRCADDVARP
jgi:hypothetical protein